MRKQQIARWFEAHKLDFAVITGVKCGPETIGDGPESSMWPPGLRVCCHHLGKENTGGVLILAREDVASWSPVPELVKKIIPGAQRCAIRISSPSNSLLLMGVYCPDGPADVGWEPLPDDDDTPPVLIMGDFNPNSASAGSSFHTWKDGLIPLNDCSDPTYRGWKGSSTPDRVFLFPGNGCGIPEDILTETDDCCQRVGGIADHDGLILSWSSVPCSSASLEGQGEDSSFNDRFDVSDARKVAACSRAAAAAISGGQFLRAVQELDPKNAWWYFCAGMEKGFNPLKLPPRPSLRPGRTVRPPRWLRAHPLYSALVGAEKVGRWGTARMIERSIRGGSWQKHLLTATVRDLWRYIAKKEGRKSTRSALQAGLDWHGHEATSPQEKADLLAMVNNPTPEPEAEPPLSREELNVLHNSGEPAPVTRAMVRRAVRRGKRRKAPGPTGFTHEMFKGCEELYDHLVTLFGMWDAGHCPPEAFESTIVCLDKPGKLDSDPSAKRPICLLEVCLKYWEHTVLQRAEIAMGEGGIGGSAAPTQFAFRVGGSTEAALLHLHSIVGEHQKKGRRVVIVSCDVKGAYPSVHPLRMTRELIECGWPGWCVRAMHNIYTRWTFRVRVQGEESLARRSELGLAQGSVASPILYALYTRTLGEEVRTALASFALGVDVIEFADDCTIVLADSDPSRLYEAVRESRRVLGPIFRKRHLHLSEPKCNMLVVDEGAKCFRRGPILDLDLDPTPEVVDEGPDVLPPSSPSPPLSPVPYVPLEPEAEPSPSSPPPEATDSPNHPSPLDWGDSVNLWPRKQIMRVLGVLWDEKCEFAAHIDRLIGQVNSRAQLLRGLRKQGLPLEKCRVLSMGLINAKLEFGAVVWASAASESHLRRVDVAVNRAYREATGLGRATRREALWELSGGISVANAFLRRAAALADWALRCPQTNFHSLVHNAAAERGWHIAVGLPPALLSEPREIFVRGEELGDELSNHGEQRITVRVVQSGITRVDARSAGTTGMSTRAPELEEDLRFVQGSTCWGDHWIDVGLEVLARGDLLRSHVEPIDFGAKCSFELPGVDILSECLSVVEAEAEWDAGASDPDLVQFSSDGSAGRICASVAGVTGTGRWEGLVLGKSQSSYEPELVGAATGVRMATAHALATGAGRIRGAIDAKAVLSMLGPVVEGSVGALSRGEVDLLDALEEATDCGILVELVHVYSHVGRLGLVLCSPSAPSPCTARWYTCGSTISQFSATLRSMLCMFHRWVGSMLVSRGHVLGELAVSDEGGSAG